MQWSPLGNYITTMHRQGCATWGGPKWERLQRFAHSNVRLIDYSPNEKYLVSYSSHEPVGPRDQASVCFNIFDTRTAKKLRVFEGPAEDYAVGTAASGEALHRDARESLEGGVGGQKRGWSQGGRRGAW